MVSKVIHFWYHKHYLRWLLMPLSWVYLVVCSLRRIYLVRFKQQHFPVPVIVVGNITVGGVGKTPLVIALAQRLRKQGLGVGIVSRGYGATIKQFPYEVKPQDPAILVGDEPLLMAKKTHCPVVIAPKRVEAADFLLKHHSCDVIISDDGLQHYALGRALEIVVIDGQRGLGNGLCLPAGPLREPKKRIGRADFTIVNGGQFPDAYSMELKPGHLRHLPTGDKKLPAQFSEIAAAVAGIGHPQRFFNTLLELGLNFKPYPFNDHHVFQENDMQFLENWIVMTEKDAVKCHAFAKDNMYYLPVSASIDEAFWAALWSHKCLQDFVST